MPWAEWLGRSSVPVLCYHNIGGNGVPLAAFTQQMRWLAASGVRALTLAELRRVLAGEPLPGPAVCLTFDDGFCDLYTRVAPLFAQLGLRGTVFVINNRLRADDTPCHQGEVVADAAHRAFTLSGDRSAWLSGAELRELADLELFEVGSHSLTHAMGPLGPGELAEIPDHWAYAPWREGGRPGPAPRLAPELARPLWREAEGRAETEAEMHARVRENLARSRQGLEDLLGRQVTALAWPWGKAHPVARRAARDAGLDLLLTLRRGPVAAGTDPLDVPRLEVRRAKGPGWFRSRMILHSRAGLARAYCALRL